MSISAATLSYWQSGRSRPERTSSRAALPHLEELLELDPGTLQRLVADTCERRSRATPHELDAVWSEPGQVAALAQLDTMWDAHLERVSLHDRLVLDAAGRLREITVHQVLRASAAGPDRRVVLSLQEDLSAPLPVIEVLRGGRLGRLVHDPATGVLAGEILFPAPLARSETVAMEYRISYGSHGPREQSYDRRHRVPLRHYVLEIDFDPHALPVAVESVRDGEVDLALSLDAEHRVHVAFSGDRSLRQGVRWAWSTP